MRGTFIKHGNRYQSHNSTNVRESNQFEFAKLSHNQIVPAANFHLQITVFYSHIVILWTTKSVIFGASK